MPEDEPRSMHNGNQSDGRSIPPDVLEWLDASSPEWTNTTILESIAALSFPSAGNRPTDEPFDKWLP